MLKTLTRCGLNVKVYSRVEPRSRMVAAGELTRFSSTQQGPRGRTDSITTKIRTGQMSSGSKLLKKWKARPGLSQRPLPSQLHNHPGGVAGLWTRSLREEVARHPIKKSNEKITTKSPRK